MELLLQIGRTGIKQGITGLIVMLKEKTDQNKQKFDGERLRLFSRSCSEQQPLELVPGFLYLLLYVYLSESVVLK